MTDNTDATVNTTASVDGTTSPTNTASSQAAESATAAPAVSTDTASEPTSSGSAGSDGSDGGLESRAATDSSSTNGTASGSSPSTSSASGSGSSDTVQTGVNGEPLSYDKLADKILRLLNGITTYNQNTFVQKSDYVAAVAYVESGISGLQDSTKKLSQSTTALSSSLSSLTDRVTKLENFGTFKQIQSNTDSINSLQGDLEVAKADLATTENNMSTLTTDVIKMRSDVDANRKDINTLLNKDSTDESDITSLQTGLSAAQKNVSDLQSGLSTTESSLKGTQSDVASLQSGLSKTQDDVSGLKNDTGNIRADLTFAQDAIKDVQKQADNNDAGLSSVQKESDANKQGIADLNTNMSSLRSDVNDNKESIGNLQKEADQNKADIATTQKGLSDLQASVTEDESHINDLKNGYTALNSAVGNQQTGITQAQSDIKGLRSDLTTTQQNVANNATGVADAQKSLSTLENQIDTSMKNHGFSGLDGLASNVSENRASLNRLMDGSAQIIGDDSISAQLGKDAYTPPYTLHSVYQQQQTDMQTIADVQKGLSGTEEQVKTNTDDISKLKDESSDTQKQLGTLNQNVSTLMGGETSLSSAISAITGVPAGTNPPTTLADLNTQVEQNTQSLESTENQLNAVYGELGNYERVVRSLVGVDDNASDREQRIKTVTAPSVFDIKKEADQNSSDIAVLQKDAGNYTRLFDNLLGSTDGSLDSATLPNVVSLEKQVDQNTSDIASVKNEVESSRTGGSSALTTVIGDKSYSDALGTPNFTAPYTLNSVYTQQQTDMQNISNLQSATSSNKSDLDGLRQSILPDPAKTPPGYEYPYSIKQLRSDVDSLQGKQGQITQNQQDISTLKKGVSDNTSAIQTETQNRTAGDTALGKRIDGVVSQVNTLSTNSNPATGNLAASPAIVGYYDGDNGNYVKRTPLYLFISHRSPGGSYNQDTLTFPDGIEFEDVPFVQMVGGGFSRDNFQNGSSNGDLFQGSYKGNPGWFKVTPTTLTYGHPGGWPGWNYEILNFLIIGFVKEKQNG